MYGKIVDSKIEHMPTNGTNESGCQYVIDSENVLWASDNGYKKLIYDDYPDDGKNYNSYIKSEDSLNIYLGWQEISVQIDPTTKSINDLNSDMTDTMGTVDALLTTFIPMMLV